MDTSTLFIINFASYLIFFLLAFGALTLKTLSPFKRGILFFLCIVVSGNLIKALFSTPIPYDIEVFQSINLHVILSGLVALLVPNQVYNHLLKTPASRNISFVGDVNVVVDSINENPVISITGNSVRETTSDLKETSVNITEEQARNLWGEMGAALNKFKNIRNGK